MPLGENPYLKCAARKTQGGEKQERAPFPWSLQTFTKGLKTNTLEVQELVTSKPGSPAMLCPGANSPALTQRYGSSSTGGAVELSSWLCHQQTDISFDVLEMFL